MQSTAKTLIYTGNILQTLKDNPFEVWDQPPFSLNTLFGFYWDSEGGAFIRYHDGSVVDADYLGNLTLVPWYFRAAATAELAAARAAKVTQADKRTGADIRDACVEVLKRHPNSVWNFGKERQGWDDRGWFWDGGEVRFRNENGSISACRLLAKWLNEPFLLCPKATLKLNRPLDPDTAHLVMKALPGVMFEPLIRQGHSPDGYYWNPAENAVMCVMHRGNERKAQLFSAYSPYIYNPDRLGGGSNPWGVITEAVEPAVIAQEVVEKVEKHSYHVLSQLGETLRLVKAAHSSDRPLDTLLHLRELVIEIEAFLAQEHPSIKITALMSP